MNKANLTILGSGSALPTYQNSPAGQILTIADKSFLIDCGEGVQITMRQMGIKTSRLYSIFISHLHGDHCFGLIGLISTLSMLHRTQPLHIYAHADLEKLLRPWLEYHCEMLTYEVIFHAINPHKHEVIFTDRTITVETIPLKHKVPCCGFLFIEHHRLMPVVKRYAYCSDTAYYESIIPIIEGVHLLFHESTFTEDLIDRCRITLHSTAKQAAIIAQKANAQRLLIGHYSSRVENHEEFLKEATAVFPNVQLAIERKIIEF